MPVAIGEHTHVWQYKFRPIPYPVLDRDFDARDDPWRLGLVDRLSRGAAGPRALSVWDVFPVSDYSCEGAGGWEGAEAHSKKANRIGAAFLNDAAIERRLFERGLRKAAWEDWKAQDQARRDAKKARLEEAAAARAEAERAWREKKEAKARADAEANAEWERRKAELKAVIAPRADEQAARAALARRVHEQGAIFAARWQCQKCLKPASIEMHLGRYALVCQPCGSRSLAEHQTLVDMMAAAA